MSAMTIVYVSVVQNVTARQATAGIQDVFDFSSEAGEVEESEDFRPVGG